MSGRRRCSRARLPAGGARRRSGAPCARTSPATATSPGRSSPATASRASWRARPACSPAWPRSRRRRARSTPALAVEVLVHDGERFAAGDALAELRGPLAAILAAERTALNFLCRLSGVATLTAHLRRRDRRHGGAHRRHAQDHAGPARPREAGRGARRRHAAPLRPLRRRDDQGQPRGGGRRRRRRRRAACAPARRTCTRSRSRSTRSSSWTRRSPRRDHRAARQHGHGRRCAQAVARVAGRAVVEVSGGVRLERVRELAEAGVDVISVGALTTRAPWIDLALDLEV